MEIFRGKVAEQQIAEFRVRLGDVGGAEIWYSELPRADLAAFDEALRVAMDRRGDYDRIWVACTLEEVFRDFDDWREVFGLKPTESWEQWRDSPPSSFLSHLDSRVRDCVKQLVRQGFAIYLKASVSSSRRSQLDGIH